MRQTAGCPATYDYHLTGLHASAACLFGARAYNDCGQTVYHPAREIMERVGEAIFFEVRDQMEYYRWRAGRAELDSGAGVITVYGVRGKAPLITVPASAITGFEITMREGISILPHIALGALLADSNTGYGCLLSLILAPAAAIDRIIATRTRFPVVRLAQSVGDGAEQESMLWLRSKRRGRRGREETREFANRLAGMPRESGYGGVIPDLSDEELWFGAG